MVKIRKGGVSFLCLAFLVVSQDLLVVPVLSETSFEDAKSFFPVPYPYVPVPYPYAPPTVPAGSPPPARTTTPPYHAGPSQPKTPTTPVGGCVNPPVVAHPPPSRSSGGGYHYNPPSSGSSGGGSRGGGYHHNPPSSRSGGGSTGGGYHHNPPSSGSGGGSTGGYTYPSPPVVHNPPSGSTGGSTGGYSYPTPPSSGSSGGGGGGILTPPTTPVGGGTTPTTPMTPIGGGTTPTTPTTPVGGGTTPTTPPYFPITDPFTGTCNFWRTHPAIIFGMLGWFGTVGTTFGVTNVPGLPSNLNLLQALSNTRNDGLGQLYREGTASFLNSMVNHKFTYTTQQVRDHFVTSLGSDSAAAAQARLFKLANEGHFKTRE